MADVGLERDRPEPERGDVHQKVPRAASGRDVSVCRRDEHVAVVVAVPESRLQAADYFQMNCLEHQPHIDGHVGHAAPVSVVEDERAGELALVETRRDLLRHRIAVHPGAEGFAGDVRHAPAHVHGDPGGARPICRVGRGSVGGGVGRARRHSGERDGCCR